MKRLVLVSLLFVYGCPKDTSCFVGDPAAQPEIEAVFRDVDGEMKPLLAGGNIPLILPPQGGKVMFVGVRAKNVDGCPVDINTSIRDTCSNAIIALERRPVTLTEDGTGWLEPLQKSELTNYSNLPACPRANLERDVHEQPYLLNVRVTDKDGRTAEKQIEVVPFCGEPDQMDRCICECRSDYTLGQEC